MNKAKRPLFLVGGGVKISHATEEFTELVNITNVPVVTTIMGRGAISTNHPLYIGNLVCTVRMPVTWRSMNVICCFQSEPDSMTELPASCILCTESADHSY